MFGDGSQSRDFTYVTDIARGSVAATKEIGYEIINLGGGRNPVSLNVIIENLEALLGKKQSSTTNLFMSLTSWKLGLILKKLRISLDGVPRFHWKRAWKSPSNGILRIVNGLLI